MFKRGQRIEILLWALLLVQVFQVLNMFALGESVLKVRNEVTDVYNLIVGMTNE